MTDFESAARTVTGRLEVLGVGFALVGGFAVSIWTEPRFTRDIDLVVAVSDDEGAEQVVRSLVEDGHKVLATAGQERVGRLATVRLGLRQGDDLVDLLFASSGIEQEVATAAERIEVLPSLALPVARIGHLIALKLLASDEQTRPQDGLDLRALLAVADHDDLDMARRSIRLIEARGYQRGKDLGAALDNLVRPS